MEIIIRAIFVYMLILVVFRMSGKRVLSQMTAFDFVLLILVGEATHGALLGEDYSLTGAVLAVGTLVTLDVFFAYFSNKSDLFDKITNGVPVIVLKNGEPVQSRMDEENIEIDDILEAARRTQGLENLDQIKYAVLERDGEISIVPEKYEIGKATEV